MQGAAARGFYKFPREEWIDERVLAPTCVSRVVVAKRGN